jgi:hypothetical protein
VIASDILIIVPSRGRPHSVAPLLKAWRKAGTEAELLLALDEDDPALQAYLDAVAELPDVRGSQIGQLMVQIGPRRRLVGTLNEVATLFAPDYAAVGFMGDDHRPRTPGWDQRFATCLSGGAGIVYGNDMLVGERFPTAVVMTSDIIQTLGWAVSPTCPTSLSSMCTPPRARPPWTPPTPTPTPAPWSPPTVPPTTTTATTEAWQPTSSS